MADIAAVRTYLRDPIGLGLDANGTAKANAVIAEGITNIEDLVDLNEDEGIKTLCQNIRKPAGTIPDPAWVAPVPNNLGLVAPNIPRPGLQIPAICENRLTLAAYGATIYSSINRTYDTASLSRARLREFKKHKEMVSNHTEPDALPSINKTFTVTKFLDLFPTHLRELHGINDVALSYVIREPAAPPATLPVLQALKPWAVGQNSLMGELIAYTPHTGPAYDSDNARVYALLSNALSGTSAMASITRFQRSRNGRQAYLSLVTNCLGSEKWVKTVEVAEDILHNRVWNGKNSRYPIKVHIGRHREAYNDLERASQHITYTPPNEDSRVRYLLNSLQTSDPTICAAKTTIQADPVKKANFEQAADFVLTMIPVNKIPGQRLHTISGLKSKHGKIKTGPKTGVELRFYKKHEWLKLSQEQRDECVQIRKEEKRKRSGEKLESEYSKKIAVLETRIKDQELQIASIITNDDNDENKDTLPPKPSKNPLKPPKGFTQRGGD